MNSLVSRGLYALTDEHLMPPARFTGMAEEALRGGAQLLQYRDKSSDDLKREAQAGALKELCAAYNIPLIINDDIELALKVGAQGVHLGGDDADPAEARKRLGRHALIGVSCYNNLARAVRLEKSGVDYAAFGRFFSSRTKPGAQAADLDLLRAARQKLRLPLVAIGGVTAGNGAALRDAGADLLAAVHGVFGAADVYTAARLYSELFEERKDTE